MMCTKHTFTKVNSCPKHGGCLQSSSPQKMEKLGEIISYLKKKGRFYSLSSALLQHSLYCKNASDNSWHHPSETPSTNIPFYREENQAAFVIMSRSESERFPKPGVPSPQFSQPNHPTHAQAAITQQRKGLSDLFHNNKVGPSICPSKNGSK